LPAEEAGWPLLVLVTGPPATGKTTIAIEIARQLRLPAFHKDQFKERLADELPGDDLPWSQSLGRAAFVLLYHAGQVLIDAGYSCLLEANFHPELSLPELRRIAAGADVAQVVCAGDPAVLVDRYLARHDAGPRHPVHLDTDASRREQLEESFRRDHRLDLAGLVIACDATAREPIDPDAVVHRIRAWRGTGDDSIPLDCGA
jgi:predicted kinase